MTLLFGKFKPDRVKKVLVFRTGSIGDVICALPALSAIRNQFPERQIDILTHSGGSSMVSLEQLIDSEKFNEIINYHGQGYVELFERIAKEKYDLFIELPQYRTTLWSQLRNQFFIRMAGIKQGFGWAFAHSLLFSKWQEKFKPFVNERDRLLEILKRNGVSSDSYEFSLGIDTSVKEQVVSVLKTHDLINKNRNIGMAIGSKQDRNKWPLENFISIAKHFSSQGYNICIFGGGNTDFEQAERIRVGERIFNFCGSFSPIESAEAMKYCKVLLCNDSGPMHMAYAVGTPVVALFSARDYPGKWFPPEDSQNVVYRSEGVSCSICFKRVCSDNICMKRIDVNEVIGSIEGLLQ